MPKRQATLQHFFGAAFYESFAGHVRGGPAGQLRAGSMAGKAIQAIFGTRSRMESVLAWGAAVGITYAWYKWDASKQVESGGAPEFTAAESEAWNQKVRVAHPEAFTAAVAKETARAEAAGKASLAAKLAEAGSASQPPEDSPQNSAAS